VVFLIARKVVYAPPVHAPPAYTGPPPSDQNIQLNQDLARYKLICQVNLALVLALVGVLIGLLVVYVK
jgi:hypothetical protein